MSITLGTLGAGPIAQGVAAHALRAGHRVVLSNSRGPETLAGLVSELGEGAVAVTVEQAAAADLVLLAVPFIRVPEVGRAVGDWTGKVVIDATNHYAHSNPYEGRFEIGELTASEWVAERLPGAIVVKAFNDLAGRYVAADPRHADGRQVAFYAGDDRQAKAAFDDLVRSFGFWPVDLGPLRDGGRLTQLDGPLHVLNALTQR